MAWTWQQEYRLCGTARVFMHIHDIVVTLVVKKLTCSMPHSFIFYFFSTDMSHLSLLVDSSQTALLQTVIGSYFWQMTSQLSIWDQVLIRSKTRAHMGVGYFRHTSCVVLMIHTQYRHNHCLFARKLNRISWNEGSDILVGVDNLLVLDIFFSVLYSAASLLTQDVNVELSVNVQCLYIALF